MKIQVNKKTNHTLNHRLIVYVLLISLFLQSCDGFKNQIVLKEKEQTNKILELPDKPLRNTDKKFITSGGYLASFYEENGVLKADLKVDENQPSNNYKAVPVVVEPGTNLFELTTLDPKTQKQRIELNCSNSRQLKCVIIRAGGLAGGMKRNINNNINNQRNFSSYLEKTFNWLNLPEEIAIHILSFLSLGDLKKIRFISKLFFYQSRATAACYRSVPEAQYYHGLYLQKSPDPKDKEKGVKLVSEAEKHGYSPGKTFIQDKKDEDGYSFLHKRKYVSETKPYATSSSKRQRADNHTTDNDNTDTDTDNDDIHNDDLYNLHNDIDSIDVDNDNIGTRKNTQKLEIQDYQKALEWYQKAADQGNAAAQAKVEELCEAGTHLPS